MRSPFLCGLRDQWMHTAVISWSFLLRIIGVVPRQNPIRVQTGRNPRTRTLFREGFGPGKNLSAIAKSDQKMVHCSVRGHGEHFHPSFSLKFVES